jgi:DNA-directed RNA polymerase specialized sigma24 family protein
MGSRIKGVALALAGLGLLTTGIVGKDNARLVHEQMRTRILALVGGEQVARDEVRAALRGDPDFDRLLAYHRKRLLQGKRIPDLAEDAAQATLYKIWKGSPEIFLRDHDVVERYMSVAMKRNFATEMKRASARPDESVEELGLTTEDESAEATEARDLWDALNARCAPEEREVLRRQLDGARSVREIAEQTGLTRYTVHRSSKKLADRLERLQANA